MFLYTNIANYADIDAYHSHKGLYKLTHHVLTQNIIYVCVCVCVCLCVCVFIQVHAYADLSTHKYVYMYLSSPH